MNKEIFKEYAKVRYGNKRRIWEEVAKETYRATNTTRNWFVVKKNIPERFQELTLKILKDATRTAN